MTDRLTLQPSGKTGSIAAGVSMLDAARRLGVEIESICGGRQTCGKCLIVPEDDNLTPPGEAERAYAERHGIDLNEKRLACAACATGDVVVYVPETSRARKQIVRKAAGERSVEVIPAVRLYYVEVQPAELGEPGDWTRLRAALAAQWGLRDLTIDPLILRTLQTALRKGDWTVTVTVWGGREVIRVEPGYVESLYGVAVDVGTTTLALHLCDLRTGAVLATETTMNPQGRYGEDLMSRVSYGMMEPQGVHRLRRAVVGALNELLVKAASRAGVDPAEVTDAVLVGNTVMHHLLLGIDPVELGGAPFVLATEDALDLKARDMGLKAVGRGAYVHLLPCIAGHVGADNVAVLLAEQPFLDDAVSLIVDIGTNAEILLGTKDRMLSASSPTGPAFEGAQITHGQRAAPGAIERVRIRDGLVRYKVIGDERWSDETDDLEPTGICGSGIIEAVGELVLAGLVEPNGRFARDAADRSPCIRRQGRTAELVLDGDIVVTQNDIRAIQLAKGALYAGVRLLMDRMGVAWVDRVRLAGAFGSYIDPYYARAIGLVPDCEQIVAAGNAAGDGARIALLNRDQRNAAAAAARAVDYVETAIEPAFQEYFVAAMAFPQPVRM